MMWVVVFLLGLPVCVWLLASACAVIDEPQPLRALVRVIAEICVLVVLLLLTERDYVYPLGVAMVTVIALHLAAHAFLLRRGTGVPVYQQVPPPGERSEDDDVANAER